MRRTGISGNWVLFVFEDSKGRFWISTWADGITLFEPDKLKFTWFKYNQNRFGSIKTNDIENIIEDKQGNIWVAVYGGGLSKFVEPVNGKDAYFINYSFNYNDPLSLADNKVLNLFKDRSGIIWVATTGHGICRFDPQTLFENIRLIDKNGLIKYSPSSIIKTSDGNLWVGTKEGILFRFNNNRSKIDRFDLIKNTKVRPNAVFITSFLEDEEGTLWISTDGGGIRYITKDGLNSANPSIKYFAPAKSFQNKTFPTNFGFARETLYKDIIFGSFTQESTWILRRKNNLKKVFDLEYFDYRSFLWSYENDGTSIWLGAFSHGVAKFDLKTSKRSFNFVYLPENPYDKRGIPNGNIYSILKAKDNSLWFGTQKSLSCLLPNCDTLIHYTYKNGLCNEQIFGILEDDNGCLWLSTYNGLSKFNLKTRIFTNYYREDGIQGNEFSQFSYYKDKDGLLYFGGTYGITLVNPSKIMKDISSSEVKITGLYLSNLIQDNKSLIKDGIINQAFPFTREISLSYNQNAFSIAFSALEYSAPQKIKYLYKLEGFDKDWIAPNQSSRVAYYMNLSPNTYVFKVRSTNREGVWNSAFTELQITIAPPFWNTLWFKAIICLSIFAIVITIYTWRNASYQKRQALLQTIVDEKTVQLRESNAALETFSYSVSHDLRAPLRTINSFSKIIQEDFGPHLPDEVNIYFEKINKASSRMGELIEGILKLARLSSIEIHKTEVNLSLLVEISLKNSSYLFKDKQIASQIEPDIIVQGDQVLLATVVDNLISNSIKFSSKNELIKIDFGKTENFDKSQSNTKEAIFLKDYGAGFDMNLSHKLFQVFQRIHNQDEFDGTGIGLANVKKIINRHGGAIWAESEVGKGATFYFTLP